MNSHAPPSTRAHPVEQFGAESGALRRGCCRAGSFDPDKIQHGLLVLLLGNAPGEAEHARLVAEGAVLERIGSEFMQDQIQGE